MNDLTARIIIAVVSIVFGFLSSIFVYKIKFNQEEKRYRERKVETWEDEAMQELESARQILIDITTHRHQELNSGRFDDTPPDEIPEQIDSPKFDRIDKHVTSIQELTGSAPDKHDDVPYHFTQIAFNYRNPPASDMSQSQAWEQMEFHVKNAIDKINSSEDSN